MQSDNEILNEVCKSYNNKNRITFNQIFEFLYSNWKAIVSPWLQCTWQRSVCCEIQITFQSAKRFKKDFAKDFANNRGWVSWSLKDKDTSAKHELVCKGLRFHVILQKSWTPLTCTGQSQHPMHRAMCDKTNLERSIQV